jgi:citrate lyase alpha subunit
MKVYVQIVDTRSGISQNGMIEESVKKGFEVANALEHFGVNINTVEWLFEHSNSFIGKFGQVKDTTKVVSVIAF